MLGNVEYHKLVPESVPLPLSLQKMEEFKQRWAAKQLKIGYNFDDGFINPVPAYVKIIFVRKQLLIREFLFNIIFRL